MVLNRDNLGGLCPERTVQHQMPQDIPGEIKGLWSTPAYWNGNVYIWGNGDVPKLFQMNSGVLGTNLRASQPSLRHFPAHPFPISSNGAQDGIAWAVRTDQFNTMGRPCSTRGTRTT